MSNRTSYQCPGWKSAAGSEGAKVPETFTLIFTLQGECVRLDMQSDLREDASRELITQD